MSEQLHGEIGIDDEIVAWSVPPEQREASLAQGPLLIVMHGYGSHEGDLISLAPYLPPGVVVASLRAPLIAPAPVVDGHAWFPMSERGNPDTAAVDASARAVVSWLDRVEGALGSRPRVGAMGFSQGGAMSLQLLRHAPDRISAVVNLSGFVVGPDSPADAELATLRPRVFWGYSDDDPIVPPRAVVRTREWLAGHATVTERMYPGIAHSISGPEIDDVSAFLRETLFD